MTTPIVPTTWASIADVFSITAKDVTQDQLNQAQAVVETYSGRTIASYNNLLSRDLQHLKKAVAYQAAWMLGQADFFTRSQVTNFSQDGVSAAYADKASITLAPLANKSIRNLSWMRSKSSNYGSSLNTPVAVTGAIYDSPFDVWKPL